MKSAYRIFPLGLAVSFGLIGCSGEPVATESEGTVTEQPSSTPVESFTLESTDPAEPIAGDPEEAVENTSESLRAMDYNEFVELPIETREVLITDMLKETTEWSFIYGENWDGNTSQLFKYNPLDIASKDNTPKEIAMQDLYMLQLALSQTKDLDTSGYFDPSISAKALSGAYIDDDYIGGGEADIQTSGSNNGYEYLYKLFAGLPVVTTHEAPQEVIEISGVERSTLTGSNGKSWETIQMTYTTNELPESLGDSFKEGTQMLVTKEFIWVEEANRWMAHKGGTGTLPSSI